MFEIQIPYYIVNLMEKLENAGFEAYVTGGCIRDSLLGIKPSDWDMCTSAAPYDMKRVFSDMKIVLTGEKHGTVTVVTDESSVEITSFRKDGCYSDARHPDNVDFVTDIKEDLARRDFTVNAMAYGKTAGIIDLYGGREDLSAGILRAVGNPVRRFEEDALRILRALRFMSVYGFEADPGLERAIRAEYYRISDISMERIQVEFTKFLNGKRAADLLDEYRDIFCMLIPELTPMIDLNQHSPYHNRDVWQHTLAAVADVPAIDHLRLIMLLHDIGKPVVYVRDETGRGRFVGHPEVGAKIAVNILKRMKFSNEIVAHIEMLINYHDVKLYPDRPTVRKWLGVLGRKNLELLQLIRHADASGKYEESKLEIEAQNPKITALIDAIEKDGDCTDLKSLAVNGNDVRSAGIENGRRIGETLAMLLDKVIQGKLPNDRDTLISECRQLAKTYDEKDKKYAREYVHAHSRNAGNRCVIFSGAPECSLSPNLNLKEAFVIACDIGYLHSVGAGVWAQLVVGDFDSYSGEIYGRTEVIRAPAEKDDTDTLIALKEAIKRGYTDITIVGALGGRTDHAFANLQLCCYAAERGVSCRISDAAQELFVIKDETVKIARQDFKRISIFALDKEVEGVTLKGLKYEVEDESFLREFPRGVSNEFAGEEAEVSVKKGMLLINVSRGD